LLLLLSLPSSSSSPSSRSCRCIRKSSSKFRSGRCGSGTDDGVARRKRRECGRDRCAIGLLDAKRATVGDGTAVKKKKVSEVDGERDRKEDALKLAASFGGVGVLGEGEAGDEVRRGGIEDKAVRYFAV
jgi:hypothetical protein